jgi:hypothetical protein
VNGFASAFLPWPERESLVERAKGEIAALRTDRGKRS